MDNHDSLLKQNPQTEKEPHGELPQQWRFLFSARGEEILQKLQNLKTGDPLKLIDFARRKLTLTPEQAGIAAEQIHLRKKAEAKFPKNAPKMLFTAVGLEQSTDQWIARYKAAKFPKNLPAADICCGIGGDLCALAMRGPALGVDLNPVTAAAAAHNLGIFLNLNEKEEKDLSNPSAPKETDSAQNSRAASPKVSETDTNHSNTQKFDKKFAKNEQIKEQILLKNVLINENTFSAHSEASQNSVFPDNGASEKPPEKESRVLCVSAEEFLEQYPPEAYPCLHIDPDRRSQGVRTSQLTWFAPSRETIEKLLENRHTAAVKLAPGTEIPEEWLTRASELEWIGRRHECMELVVWFRGGEKTKKTEKPARRRAVILNGDSSEVSGFTEGEGGLPIPAAEIPGKYLFDIESTVLAAGLEGQLAHDLGLKRLGPGSLYLTGEQPLKHGALSCFEILRILPLDKKQIVQEIKKRNWGNIEIKKRGSVPLPETVRTWFKQKKGESGVLILAQLSDRSVAIFANRFFQHKNSDFVKEKS